MKIAYIATIDAYQNSGVLNKIISQVNSWNQLGNESRLFILSKPPGIKKKLASAIQLDSCWVGYHPIANFITKVTGKKTIYLNKILTASALKSEVKTFSPHIIFYRFSIWFPGQISSINGYPAIIELNTNDLDEFKLYDKLTRFIHLYTRKWLLNRADGFCCVSGEISHLIALPGTPSLVLGNGVDISTIKQRPVPNNQRAQLVFVGSSGHRWHGVEKIIALAEKLPQYDFHIVGPDKNDFSVNHENIYFYGFLEQQQLSEVYKKMDVAIGTLALHEKNMVEASPLKVREYVAYGLPVIVGFKDTDLSGKSFILDIGNYGDNVRDNIGHITKFVEFWKNKALKVDINCIDVICKEKERLSFFKSFIN